MNKNEIRTVPLSQVSNVVSGGTVTINLPTIDTYHKVLLETGISYSKMTEVKLIVDGSVAWELNSMQELVNILDKYNSIPTSTGVLQIPFVMNQLNQLNERVLSALGTADISTLVLQFKIATDVTNPTITATAEVSDNTNIGLMLHIKKSNVDYASTGIKTITTNNIPKGFATPMEGKDVYPRLLVVHFENDGVDDFELKTGNTSRYKASRTLLKHQLKSVRPNARTEQTGYTHIDFLRNGTIAGAFNMIYRDLSFVVDVNLAGNYNFTSVFLAPHRGV
mgnify:CR=1 FL=1